MRRQLNSWAVNSLLPALLLCLAQPLLAGPRNYDAFQPISQEELHMTSEPKAPGASAVMLQYAYIRNDNTGQLVVYKRIKIFTEAGKKYGDIELPYLKHFYGFDIHGVRARTIEPDGRIVPFTGKVYEKTIYKYKRFRFTVKALAMPEVQPGCILEVIFHFNWDNRLLFSNTWEVQQTLFVKSSYFNEKQYDENPALKIYWESHGWDGRMPTLHWASVEIPGGKAPEKTSDGVELAVQDVPAFEEEQYSPPREELIARVELFYGDAYLDPPDKFWARAGQDLKQHVEDFIGRHGRIDEAVSKLVSSSDTPEQKLKKVYVRSQEVRNLTYGRPLSEQEKKELKDNKSVEDVLTHGYAYRNQINRLFVAMARSAGFHADVVRLGQRDGEFFAKDRPDAGQLDGEVAVVDLDTRSIYFDPGTPYCPFGLLSWENTGVTGIRLQKDPAFVQTPIYAPNMALTKRVADLKYADGGLKGKIVISYDGQDALTHRLQSLRDDEASVKDDITNDLKHALPEGAVIKLTALQNLKDADLPLVAEFDADISSFGSPTGAKLLMPIAIFSQSEGNPFTFEKRKYPVYFDYLYEARDEITIALPDDMTVQKLPVRRFVSENFAAYEMDWGHDPHKIVLTRQFAVENLFFPLDQYASLRSFYEKVGMGDQENAIVTSAQVASKN